MGHFRSASSYDFKFLFPGEIEKAHTIKNGEWYLEIKAKDTGVCFVAQNNLYSEWLWDVTSRGFFFNLFFGCYVSRLTRAKKKYQKWINKKNTEYFYAQQIITII